MLIPRALAAALSLVLASTVLAGSGAAHAEPEGDSPAGFLRVRTFTRAKLPESDFKAELFRKVEGNATFPDIVDLNQKFVEQHGKPSQFQPEFAPQTSIMMMQFPDGWVTINMVGAKSDGQHICRFKFRKPGTPPDENEFGKFVDWCRLIVGAANLDPTLVGPP